MGSDRSNKIAVIITDQMNKGSFSISGDFILIVVVMKLMAPKIELTPARCKEKIARSTAGPLWVILPATGVYTVQYENK